MNILDIQVGINIIYGETVLEVLIINLAYKMSNFIIQMHILIIKLVLINQF